MNITLRYVTYLILGVMLVVSSVEPKKITVIFSDIFTDGAKEIQLQIDTNKETIAEIRAKLAEILGVKSIYVFVYRVSEGGRGYESPRTDTVGLDDFIGSYRDYQLKDGLTLNYYMVQKKNEVFNFSNLDHWATFVGQAKIAGKTVIGVDGLKSRIAQQVKCDLFKQLMKDSECNSLIRKRLDISFMNAVNALASLYPDLGGEADKFYQDLAPFTLIDKSTNLTKEHNDKVMSMLDDLKEFIVNVERGCSVSSSSSDEKKNDKKS